MAVLFRSSTGDTAFATAGNWKLVDGTNQSPVSNDTLVVGAEATDILSTLNQSALTGITLIILQAFEGVIGAFTGQTPTYLQIGATSVTIGQNTNRATAPGGSPLLLLDVGASANTTRVLNSSTTSSDLDFAPIQLKGSDIALHVSGGNVAVAPRRGETSTVKEVNVGYTGEGVVPDVLLGPGVTITATTGKIRIAAGRVTNYSESGTTLAEVTLSGGDYHYLGTQAHTNLFIDSGYCEWSGIGTCTLARVDDRLDCSKDSRSKTITTIQAYEGATVNLDNGKGGSITHEIQFIDTDPSDVTYSLPANMKATPSAI